MKNIHILPTDKPSRLFEIDNHLIINREQLIQPKYYRNIYITSDEVIKDGYYLDLTHNIIMKSVFYPSSDKNCKKIILTTDQYLIRDGVQEIDDEFLEWFVNNPSCEEVMIETFMNREYEWGDDGSSGHTNFYMRQRYKIIIPKEEPKLTNTINRNELGIPKGTLTELIGVPKQESLSWDELIREAGSEEQLIKILKLPHIAPLAREAMRNECKKK